MRSFHYAALGSNGDRKSGFVTGETTDDAISQVRRLGLHPIEVKIARVLAPDEAVAARRIGASAIRLPVRRAISRRDLAVFTRQMSTLVVSGVPLVRGLEMLARREASPSMSRLLEALARDIRAGGTVADSMARHPRVFDSVFVNMVRAGETAGALATVLHRLAEFQEKSSRLRGRVKAALAYPIIVLAVAVAILTGLLAFVVPRFQQIFSDLLKGAPLPGLTQAILDLSSALRAHGVAAVAAAAAVPALFWTVGRTARGRRATDAIVLRLPALGGILARDATARVCRTLATLLGNGVPVLTALVITRDTCANSRIANAIQLTHDEVKAGVAMAPPLEASGIFPAMVPGMVEVGEQTGRLPEMLGRIADIYEAEVEAAVSGLSSVLEPVLIVILALVVGTIVIALFLPIVRIVQLL